MRQINLLTRENFKKSVFERDKQKCIICNSPAKDAHHIIDRSLWENGGYYLDNGVSLCEVHHVQAEMTLLDCEELRKKANITNILLPDHFFKDNRYDHWGNIIMPNGQRLKGELFGKENVQNILKKANLLDKFLPYVKYPRTYHLPWSPNLQNDDRMHQNVSFFERKEIVVTIKMDGENSNLYKNYFHARSIDSKHHISRDYVKALHGSISHEIPEGWRISGENLYAKHSIHYKHLSSFFLVFSIWDNKNYCLSWDETKEWTELLNFQTVSEIYKGIWDPDSVQEAFEKAVKTSKDPLEGYVVRTTEGFPYDQYRNHTAKYVRKGHVQTDQFWMSKPVIPNELKIIK